MPSAHLAVSRTGEAVDMGVMSEDQRRTIRRATGAHSPRSLAQRMTTSQVPMGGYGDVRALGNKKKGTGNLPPPPPVLFADQLNPVYAAEARRRAGPTGWKEHSRGAATRAADPSNFAKGAAEQTRPVAEF